MRIVVCAIIGLCVTGLNGLGVGDSGLGGPWLTAVAQGGEIPCEISNDPPGVHYNGQFFGYRGGRKAASGCLDACCELGPCLEGCDGDSPFGVCELADCPPLVYGDAEALLWWSKECTSPSLATTSLAGTAEGNAGVSGLASTLPLFGGPLHDDLTAGGRLTLGTWLNGDQASAVEASFTFLGENRATFSASDADMTILARPFFNFELNANDARLIAFPGLIDGSLDITSSTEFQSMALTYRRVAQRSPAQRLDLLFGYRFAHLEDLIEIREQTTALSGPEAGASRDLVDRFSSGADFHGGEVGVSLQRPVAPQWTMNAGARVALGATERFARVSGQTTVTTVGGTATSQGGLLTQASNIGRRSESAFGALSEFEFELKRRINRNLKLTAGYTILLWSDVWRAAEQIDGSLNPTQIPPGALVGEARPEFRSNASAFWTQGIRLGFEATY
ncbi:MAG: BBP7 family outer membrane beta-barrel protein [Planctomycetales bacterium]|nr:BBP7 family outer membrane beta-barrel protein [Planctomycetales bacterium]